ncbi:MAG: 30S ribosomal protein S6 [Thermodesulfovibrionia bacterium]|nr:30S ribosomal protein S6 [Thermodesulfovibrionia bacterium]
MTLYEQLFILDTNLDEKVKEEQIAKVTGLIVENGGEILKTTNLGSRKLSYPIRKQEKGEYILLVFNSPPAAMAKLERLCKLSENILKFMIIKIEKKKHIAAVLKSLITEPVAEPVADTEAAGDAVVTSEPAETEETSEDVQ